MDVISFWERGVIYTAGRDYLYRPLVVIDFSRAGGLTLSEMDIKKALFQFFDWLIREAMVGGQVQHWHAIIDLKGVDLAGNFGLVKTVVSFLSTLYRIRMVRTYLLNFPSALSFIWSIVKRTLSEKTAQKIRICEGQVSPQLFQFFNPSQVQRKYGGTAPDITSGFFPVKELSSEYGAGGKRAPLKSEEEYYSLFKRGALSKRRVDEKLISRLQAKEEEQRAKFAPSRAVYPEQPSSEQPIGRINSFSAFFSKQFYLQLKY